jgi:hypothetical protein
VINPTLDCSNICIGKSDALATRSRHSTTTISTSIIKQDSPISALDPDPNPDWIWIQSGQWFQEGKNDPTKNGKKVKKFHVLKCWMFSVEG